MHSRKRGATVVASMAMTLAFGCESSPHQSPTYTPWPPQPTYPAPFGQGHQTQPYGPQPYGPQPSNAPPPIGPHVPPNPPAAHRACVITETAQTWKGSAKCSKATGQCERSASGELTIQRTGPKSAIISTSGYTDGGASFDPATCTVSHAHWTPKAPIAIALSYSFVVSPEGRLSGSLSATVDSSVFGCTGSYSLSGTKK